MTPKHRMRLGEIAERRALTEDELTEAKAMADDLADDNYTAAAQVMRRLVEMVRAKPAPTKDLLLLAYDDTATPDEILVMHAAVPKLKEATGAEVVVASAAWSVSASAPKRVGMIVGDELRRAAVRQGIRLPRWAAVMPHLNPNAKRGSALSREELQQVQAQYPDNALRAIFELHWENVAFPAPPGPAQAKPTTCGPGQYWEANDGALGGVIVPGFASDWHESERLFRMTREVNGQPNTYEIAEREMLGSDLWTFHGTVSPPAPASP